MPWVASIHTLSIKGVLGAMKRVWQAAKLDQTADVHMHFCQHGDHFISVEVTDEDQYGLEVAA